MGKPHLSGKNDGEKLPFESHTYLQLQPSGFVNQKHPENRWLTHKFLVKSPSHLPTKQRKRAPAAIADPFHRQWSLHCNLGFLSLQLPWTVTSFKSLQLEMRGFGERVSQRFPTTMILCLCVTTCLTCWNCHLVFRQEYFYRAHLWKIHANNMHIYLLYIYMYIYIYINILIIYMCFLIHQRTRGGAPTKKIFVTAQASPFPYTSIRILSMIWAWTA